MEEKTYIPINSRPENEPRSLWQQSSFSFLNARKPFHRGKKGKTSFLTLRCKRQKVWNKQGMAVAGRHYFIFGLVLSLFPPTPFSKSQNRFHLRSPPRIRVKQLNRQRWEHSKRNNTDEVGKLKIKS